MLILIHGVWRPESLFPHLLNLQDFDMAKITKAPKQRKAELAMFEATVSRSQTPDLSLTPEEQIAACLSKVQNRRKGFKRLRDNDKEAVWSESLEEVLLEGN